MTKIWPLQREPAVGGSSDVAEASRNTPTMGLTMPTLPLDIPLHTWAVTVCGGRLLHWASGHAGRHAGAGSHRAGCADRLQLRRQPPVRIRRAALRGPPLHLLAAAARQTRPSTLPDLPARPRHNRGCGEYHAGVKGEGRRRLTDACAGQRVEYRCAARRANYGIVTGKPVCATLSESLWTPYTHRSKTPHTLENAIVFDFKNWPLRPMNTDSIPQAVSHLFHLL